MHAEILCLFVLTVYKLADCINLSQQPMHCGDFHCQHNDQQMQVCKLSEQND